MTHQIKFAETTSIARVNFRTVDSLRMVDHRNSGHPACVPDARIVVVDEKALQEAFRQRDGG